MQAYYELVPIKLKSQVPGFHNRTVAYQKPQANIGGYDVFVEISFVKNKCYITCVELSSSQYQSIALWRKQAQTIILQKKLDQDMEAAGMVVGDKQQNAVQFAAVKKGKKARMERLRACFGSLLGYVDMKFGKLTINIPNCYRVD